MVSEIRKGDLQEFNSIEGVIRKFSAVTGTLFWVRVTWVYEIVKIHRTQHLKSLHLILCILYPSQTVTAFTEAVLHFKDY